jgi:hypothetical protein
MRGDDAYPSERLIYLFEHGADATKMGVDVTRGVDVIKVGLM